MELCPVVSPDGRHLFFMRSGHVYWVDAAVIEDLRPAEAMSPATDVRGRL